MKNLLVSFVKPARTSSVLAARSVHLVSGYLILQSIGSSVNTIRTVNTATTAASAAAGS